MSANKHKFEQLKLYYMSSFTKTDYIVVNSIHGGTKLDKDWERLISEGYLVRKREGPRRNYGGGKNHTRLYITQKGRCYVKTHKFELNKIPDLYSKFTTATMFRTARIRSSSWCRILV